MDMCWVLDLKNEIAYSTTKYCMKRVFIAGWGNLNTIIFTYAHDFQHNVCALYTTIFIYIYNYIYESSKASYDSVVKGISHTLCFLQIQPPAPQSAFSEQQQRTWDFMICKRGIREKTRQVILEIISTLHPSYRNHFWSHLLRRSWHPLNVSKCTIIASTENSHSRCIQWASGLPRTVL